MEPVMCRCGNALPEHILTVAPDIRICPACRSSCIDRKVREGGLAALGSIPNIAKNGESFCIRDFRAIQPTRAELGAKTCLECQEHLDAIDADRAHQLLLMQPRPGARLTGSFEDRHHRSRRGYRVESNP